MKIVELFGPPCCGKTFISNFLEKKNKSVILSNTLVYDHAEKFTKMMN